MSPECKKAFDTYAPGHSPSPVDFQAAFDAGVNHAIDTIRSELEAYNIAHKMTMNHVRNCNHPTDLVTLAATASRQLAVIQALEHILMDLGVEL